MRLIKKSENQNNPNNNLAIKASKPLAFIMIIICVAVIVIILAVVPNRNKEANLYPQNTTTPGIYELDNRLDIIIRHPDIKKAITLFKQKRYNEAKNEFKHLLNIIHDENKKYVYFYLGEIEFVNKNYDTAKILYDHALNIDKNFFECLIKRGICASFTGNNLKAISFLKRAKSLKPKSFYVNFELAKIYVKIKRYQKALKLFNFALKIANDIRALYYKALCLYKLGNNENAIKIFEKISKTETDLKIRKAALLMSYKIMFKEKKYKKALGYLIQWKNLEPQNETVYFEMGKTFYLLKKYKKANYYLQEGYERNPQNHKILLFLSMSEIALKKYSRALSHIKVYLKSYRKDPKAFRLAGDAYYGLTEYKRSLANYNLYFKYINQSEIDHNVYFRIAKIFDALGKYKKAIKYLNKLLKIEQIPKKDIYYNLAVVYDHKGDYENSLYYLKKTLKLSANKEEVRSYIGDIFLKMNRLNQAIDFYKRVLKMSPESQIAAYKLGNAYFTQGNFNIATSYFRRIISYKDYPNQSKKITSLGFMRLGDIQQIEQNYLSAMTFYQKSVKTNDNNLDAKIRLSKMYLLTNYYKKAENTLKKLLTLVRDSKKRSIVYYLMSRLKLKQGFKDRAYDYLKQSLKLNPLNEEARLMLSQVN